MNKKLILVTGKTGVGKTYLLKKYNFKNTIYLDDFVKNNLYKKGHEVFNKVIKIFGEEIILNNKIDTTMLGKIVLKNEEKLEVLTSIVNNYVKKYLKSLNDEIYIIESATYLKYEKYFKGIFDYVVLITSSNPNVKNKFNYMKGNVELINKIDIKYDFLIDRDNDQSKILFASVVNKLISLK